MRKDWNARDSEGVKRVSICAGGHLSGKFRVGTDKKQKCAQHGAVSGFLQKEQGNEQGTSREALEQVIYGVEAKSDERQLSVQRHWDGICM